MMKSMEDLMAEKYIATELCVRPLRAALRMLFLFIMDANALPEALLA